VGSAGLEMARSGLLIAVSSRPPFFQFFPK
jgi:hypothetical protein